MPDDPASRVEPTEVSDRLKAFVPRLLAKAPSQPQVNTQWSRSLRGAVLLADISGFTPLSERLSGDGAVGAEELAAILDRVFGAMVTVIEEYGGDVLRFAGDAPIVLWSSESQDLGDVVRRAVACGLALQSAMTKVRATESASLSMRVGIGAGPLTAVAVGGDSGRWELVVLGAPIHQMGEAERTALVGEVLLSPLAASAAAGAPWLNPLPNGLCRVAPDLVGDIEGLLASDPTSDSNSDSISLTGQSRRDEIRAFVPRSLVRRLEVGHGAWLAEYRRVTVLFGALEGLDESDSDLAWKLNRAFSCLQESIYGLEGSVNQFLADDKGITLLALWGVPGHSFEDSPRRAVEAALRIHAQLPKQGLTASLGVTTARVFCGRRGNLQRAEFAVIGASVNLAARLMTQPGGRVLCDQETREAIGDALEFRPVGPLDLKGQRRLVPVFQPMTASGARRFRAVSGDGGVPAEILGRHEELDRFEAHLGRLAEGSSGLVEVVAEVGLGKTVLLEEFGRRGLSKGLRVIQSRCDAIERSRAYGAWSALVEDLLGLPRTHDDSATHERERRILDRFTDLGLNLSMAPLLNPILEINLPESDLVSQMGREVRAEAIRELLLDWMEAGLKEPCLITVDDAQWLDQASRDLALDLVRRVPSVLIVWARRPVEEGAEAVSVDEPTIADRWHLQPLAPAALLAVVRGALEARRLPGDLEELLVRRTMGNPLFAKELARSMLADGLLLVAAGVCRLKTLGALSGQQFPDSVQGVIASRMDRLEPRDQMVLKVASVFGARFTRVGVGAIHPMGSDPEELSSSCERLLVERILRPVGEREGGLEFDSQVARDVAYGLLMPLQRRSLHSAVATWIEGEESDPSASLLAHHWTLAQDDERSLYWLERAAAEAVRRGAERQAAVFYAQALRLVDSGRGGDRRPLEVIGWRRELGHAYLVVGAIEQSEEQLNRALGELGRRLPEGPLGWTLRVAREVCTQAVHWLVPPREVAADSRRWERELESARLMGLVGKLSFYRNAPLAFVVASLSAVNLSETARQPSMAASGYASIAYLGAILGLNRAARRWWDRCEASHDSRARIDGLIGQGLFAFGECRWDECDTRIDGALALAEATNDAFSRESALAVRVYRLHQEERYEESLAAGRDLLDSALERRSGQREMWGRLSVIGDLIALGRLQESFEHLAVAADLLPDADDLSQLTLHGLRARALQLDGQWGGLPRELEALRRCSREASSMSYWTAPMLVIQGQVELVLMSRASDPAQSAAYRSELKSSLKKLKRCTKTFPFARLPYLQLLAECSDAFGQPRRAERARRRAAEEVQRNGFTVRPEPDPGLSKSS